MTDTDSEHFYDPEPYYDPGPFFDPGPDIFSDFFSLLFSDLQSNLNLKLKLQEAFPKNDLFYGLTVAACAVTAIFQAVRIFVYFGRDLTLLKEGWGFKEYKILLQPLVVLGVIALLNLADKIFFYDLNGDSIEIVHLLLGLVMAFKLIDLFATDKMAIGEEAFLFPVALFSALSQIYIEEVFFGPTVAIGAVLALVLAIIKYAEASIEDTLSDELSTRLGSIYEDQVLSIIFTASVVLMIAAPTEFFIRYALQFFFPSTPVWYSPSLYLFDLFFAHRLFVAFNGFDFRLLGLFFDLKFVPVWMGLPFLLCYGMQEGALALPRVQTPRIFETAPHLKFDIEPLVEDIKEAGFLVFLEENPEEKAFGWMVEALTWGILLWSTLVHIFHLTDSGATT